MSAAPPLACPFCEGRGFIREALYTAPPKGEVAFSFNTGAYHRELYRCRGCGHFRSIHGMDMTGLYEGDYVRSTYGGAGLGASFEKIVALAPGTSDNRQRVRRVCAYARPRPGKPTLLDVGSGLCVFPHAMKNEGWDCTALDPDRNAVRHAEEKAGVKGLYGDFMEINIPGRFDLITFNKVLEHVDDPIAMLSRARTNLDADGMVYLEVPDGEEAFRESPKREEFFIDHPHIFSAASTALLCHRAGFALQTLERLREPSGKYTLYAFLTALD